MMSLRSALQFSERVTAAPVIHGSGDCAVEVRRIMLNHRFDCIAAPLPPSFQEQVEARIPLLPAPAVIAQPPNVASRWGDSWRPESDEGDEDDEAPAAWSYVPIDPCQPVIAALRIAMGEHIQRRFIDLETESFEPQTAVLPDAYALKRAPLDRFAAALLPSLPRPDAPQHVQRIRHMAMRLRELEQRFESVLFVCSVLDWPWVREAFVERHESEAEHDAVCEPESFRPDPQTLLFLFGELPFVTGLYERARRDLEDDENLSVDGVKELLLAARDAYRDELKSRARRLTPQLLSNCLKYIRNLTLIERRMTPDLFTIVMAAKQIGGDPFAMHVAETAGKYGFDPVADSSPEIRLGVDRGTLSDGRAVELVNRLPGNPIIWRQLELKKRPDAANRKRWGMQWDPAQQCSYPPEDDRIEDFRTRVMDNALKIMGADLATTEKFTTSIKDGIDIRDTLRHWYDGDIYVKVLPPNVGVLDCCVMLFDSPADPRDYTWRSTWYAEHDQESTLAFFATDFRKEPVGPGICLATYGGALFLFPPRPIPEVWTDRRLDFAETLEERLLGAACLHAHSRQIALLSTLPPGAGWRKLARRFKKQWIHVPLRSFSDETVQQLRLVHVLNGKQVRSYAAQFIRKA